MVTPDYSIISPDLDALAASEFRLLIEVNEQFFHYIIVYKNNTVVALKYYQSGGKATAEWLEEIYASDELLRRNWLSIDVIYAVPENQLVTADLIDDNSAHELLEITGGDLKKGILLTSKQDHTEIYTLFQVPSPMHRFFQNNFAAARFLHYYDVWMQDEKQDGIKAAFYPNELFIRVIKNDQLQLIQNYAYQTPEDAAYYLLTLYAQYDLSPEGTPLHISGMIVHESAIYSELIKYFRTIETATTPSSLLLAPGFEDYPAHFFLPILKLAVCGS